MRPAPDVESLKSAYLQRIAESHPDRLRPTTTAGSVNIETRAAQINSAFQILSDPCTRLRHILEILKAPTSQVLSPALGELFLDLASVFREVDIAFGQIQSASSPLVKARQFAALQDISCQMNALEAKIRNLKDSALSALEPLDAQWPAIPLSIPTPQQILELQQIYANLSYASKWISQIQDRKTRMFALQ